MPYKSKAVMAAYRRDYRKKNLPKIREYAKTRVAKVKLAVLTHYGRNAKLRCCWYGCKVADVDMLSLDHVNDDGGGKRRKASSMGVHLYEKLRGQDYPDGYQTLCFNHQMKKELLRRRMN